MPLARQTLIHEVWPDKALYGALMLLVAGFLGVLHGLMASIDHIDYPSSVPAFIRDYPGWLTLILSAATLVLAYIAQRQRRTKWALVGVATSAASMGLLLIEPVLAVIALGFLIKARYEREDTRDVTRRLTPDMWPDKSLAASLLMLLCGILTLAWWAGIMTGFLRVDSLAGYPLAIKILGALVGVGCVAAAWLLYYQRGPVVCAVMAVVAMGGMALFVVGPLLALATLVFVALAWKEREFQTRIIP